MSSLEALWLTDRAYVVPTILSVASFRRHVDRDCTVVVPTAERDVLEPILRQCLPGVEVGSAAELDHASAIRDSPTIRNRRARMELLREASDTPRMIVDSDTVFGPRAVALVSAVTLAARAAPMVAAVIEHAHAADAYLYFRPRRPDGSIRFSGPAEREATYRHVFGPDWKHLVSAPQPNNGLVISCGAMAVLDLWERFYERGLACSSVNEADDQVPLAAALRGTGLPLTALPTWANSLGAVRGAYAMYHAYAGLWRDEVRAATTTLADVSDYALACRLELDRIGEQLLEEVRPGSGPLEHLALGGFFEYADLYDEWARTRASVVEVGRTNGRGTAYLAEVIADRSPLVRFASVRHHEARHAVTPDEWFRSRRLGGAVELVAASDEGWWRFEPLDAVFLHVQDVDEDLGAALLEWFPRLRPGGVIAGPCYGLSDPYRSGVRDSVDRFSAAHAIPVGVRGDCFVLART